MRRVLEITESHPIGESNQYPLRPFPYPLRGEATLGFKQMLMDVAEATGGYAHVARDNELVRAFTLIFDEFRQSYFLEYQLRGVPREGAHKIKVEVTRRGEYTVRARRGYFIETGK